MAYYSLARYIGDGSNKTFSVPFQYIKSTDVEAYVDGVVVAFTWLTTSSIQLTITPALSATVTVKRNTNKAAKLVDYNNGSILDEQALDLQTDQLLYIAQENVDIATDSILVGDDGAIDFTGRVLRNVGDPVEATDAITLGFVSAALTEATSSATATATATAEAARDAAIVAEGLAEDAEVGAVVAKDAAVVAKGLAENAEAGAVVAKDAAVAAAASVPTLPLNGAIALTDNSILLSKLSRTGTAGQVLTSGGDGADPSYTTLTTPTVPFASSAENAAGAIESKAVDPLGIREAFNATGSAPVYACRAWVNFNGIGTVAIRASGNVSSITDNGVGVYTVNFTTALVDNQYCVVAAGGSFTTARTGDVGASAQSDLAEWWCIIRVMDNTNTSRDVDFVCASVFR